MKALVLTVTLTYSDHIRAKEIREIKERVLDALRLESEAGGGLSPEDSDAFTQAILVNRPGDPPSKALRHDFIQPLRIQKK